MNVVISDADSNPTNHSEMSYSSDEEHTGCRWCCWSSFKSDSSYNGYDNEGRMNDWTSNVSETRSNTSDTSQDEYVSDGLNYLTDISVTMCNTSDTSRDECDNDEASETSYEMSDEEDDTEGSEVSYEIYDNAHMAQVNDMMDQLKEMADLFMSVMLHTPETSDEEEEEEEEEDEDDEEEDKEEAESEGDVDLDHVRETMLRLEETNDYTSESCHNDLRVSITVLFLFRLLNKGKNNLML